MNMLRIAQIRKYPEKGAMNNNSRSLLRSLEKISVYGPDVVVTPECFLDGYIAVEPDVTAADLFEYAVDPQNSEFVKMIFGWCRANKCWCIYGCTRSDNGKVYNSALIINRKGDLVGIYDKIHCQSHDRKYTQGTSLPVFNSDFGLFGVMICADRRWPETVRILALRGAQIIFNPTYGMHHELNRQMMITRSYESEVIIAFTHPGQSLITGPAGQIICNEKSKKTFSITDVDLDQVQEIRQFSESHLKDCRRDIYY